MEGRDYPFPPAALGAIATHLNDVQREIRGPAQYFIDTDTRLSARRLQQSDKDLRSLAPGEYYRVVKAAVRPG